MIKFPENKVKKESDGTECSLKTAVNADAVSLGQKYIIENNPITCVDIDSDKYIFSMDGIFKCGPYRDITSILKQIYETGKIDNIEVLPVSMMKDIDFLFVPDKCQIFGEDIGNNNTKEEEIKPFKWYKREKDSQEKKYSGVVSRPWDQNQSCPWWTATVLSGHSNYCCAVGSLGGASYYDTSNGNIGVPIFFQMTKENKDNKEEPKKSNAVTEYNIDKMYTYLKGYITGAGFTQSMKALGYAREKHKGQFRKDGITPYIIHPLQMACYAVALGIKDDCTIATILLHDVVEDCRVNYKELPVCDTVKEAVRYMTIEYIEGEEKQVTKTRYFQNLIHNHRALIVKGLDRYMNLRTMAGTFERSKIEKNVRETAEMLLPVLKKGKEKYPELADILYVIRENIRGINNTLIAAYDIKL